MKKIILILIFLLAFVLRIFDLGLNPTSLDWDEASLGYNAYSILKTGKDEYGEFLPISIRSFGDYKPPLYTYFTILPVSVFGLTEFSVRLVSSIFGTLSVVVAYLLIRKLFPSKKETLYLLFTFLFAVSPWHIQFSRVAFEANLALFWFIAGIYFLFKGIEKGKYTIIAGIAFAFSMYAYHSPRLLVPLIIVCFCITYWKNVKEKLASFVLMIVIVCILVSPIFLQLSTSTGARLGSVTIFNPYERLGQSIQDIEYDVNNGNKIGKLLHNRRLVYGREALGGYLDHFNFDFLFLTGDAPGRHHAPQMGMLYLVEAPFVLLGLYLLLTKRERSSLFIFGWFLIAPAASAITTGTPHAVRAIFYLPTYQIFIAIGILACLTYLKNKDSMVKNVGTIMIWFVFIVNFYFYLQMYYIHGPKEYSQEWQYGYKQVVNEVTQIEDNYDKVVVTYKYDQPYIYFLFYKLTDPTWYQSLWNGQDVQRANRAYGKYEFRNIDWKNDQTLKNTLFVASPGEIPDNSSVIKTINFQDGTEAFKIVGSKASP